jgi:hypothetical protein
MFFWRGIQREFTLKVSMKLNKTYNGIYKYSETRS